MNAQDTLLVDPEEVELAPAAQNKEKTPSATLRAEIVFKKYLNQLQAPRAEQAFWNIEAPGGQRDTVSRQQSLLQELPQEYIVLLQRDK
jgi:hypothetical protein